MTETASQKQNATATPDGGCRILIVGTGAIVKKMEPTWALYQKRGARIYAADVVDKPSALAALPKETTFYNCRNRDRLRALQDEAKRKPFDCAYLSTLPELHLAEALKYDSLVHRFIIPKPIDSHFTLLETFHNQQKDAGAYNDLVGRICVHDHYRNKPLTSYLKGHMTDLLRRNGYLKNIRLYIVEHRTIQSEWRRRPSLECGMILDLAPHALSVLYELVPNEMEWTDTEGHTFQRIRREIRVVNAVLGRDNNSILHDPRAETFATLHFKVIETIHFSPKDEPKVVDAFPHEFDVLIIVGKGISLSGADDKSGERDLKAIEIEFDGQIVRGNFDTNAVSGVIDERLHERLLKEVNPDHRGLNLPMMELATNGFSLDFKNGKLISPFQSFEEAFRIARLLEDCRKHSDSLKGDRMARYHANASIGSLLNRCVAMGLDQKWALREEPTNLVFGRIPHNAIQ
jgi:hypothetical protein